jgi:TRAP-type C4-dicarboxylate transport system permease small subunit
VIKLITRLDHLFAKVEEVLLALLLVGMVLVASLQVLLRNVWNTGLDWADPALQNATLLLGLLGAAVATSEGRHLTIDIFSRALKGRLRTVLRVAIGTFAVLLCVLLAQGGWRTYQVNHAQWVTNIPSGWTAAQTLRQELLEGSIPQWLSQAMLPLGFLLMGFHFLLRLVRDLHSLATGQQWEAAAQQGLEGDAVLDALARDAGEEGQPTGRSGGRPGGGTP